MLGVLLHASRPLPVWLIFDVGRKMTPSEKQAAISTLLAERDADPNVLRHTGSRRRWLGEVVPLLSFNPTLHQNAMDAADLLVRPGSTPNHYDHTEARLLLLVRQALTELQHGLTPVIDGGTPVKKEHTLLSYWSNADWSERIGMLGVFGLIFIVGFLCGKVGFFSRLYELVKEVLPG